jgi:hypothetical protein
MLLWSLVFHIKWRRDWRYYGNVTIQTYLSLLTPAMIAVSILWRNFSEFVSPTFGWHFRSCFHPLTISIVLQSSVYINRWSLLRRNNFSWSFIQSKNCVKSSSFWMKPVWPWSWSRSWTRRYGISPWSWSHNRTRQGFGILLFRMVLRPALTPVPFVPSGDLFKFEEVLRVGRACYSSQFNAEPPETVNSTADAGTTLSFNTSCSLTTWLLCKVSPRSIV